MATKLLTYRSGEFYRVVQDPAPVVLDAAIRLIPPGSIFFSEGPTPISQVIGWFSILRHPLYVLKHGLSVPYSHCGAFLGGDGPNFDRTIEALPKGVLDSHMASHMASDRRITVWSTPLASEERVDTMTRSLEANIGKPYNWLEDIEFVLPIEDQVGAYNCLQLVVEAGHASKLLPSSVPSEDITPVDLSDWLASPAAEPYGWQRQLIYAPIYG